MSWSFFSDYDKIACRSHRRKGWLGFTKVQVSHNGEATEVAGHSASAVRKQKASDTDA